VAREAHYEAFNGLGGAVFCQKSRHFGCWYCIQRTGDDAQRVGNGQSRPFGSVINGKNPAHAAKVRKPAVKTTDATAPAELALFLPYMLQIYLIIIFDV
jgi:hypothetical protein